MPNKSRPKVNLTNKRVITTQRERANRLFAGGRIALCAIEKEKNTFCYTRNSASDCIVFMVHVPKWISLFVRWMNDEGGRPTTTKTKTRTLWNHKFVWNAFLSAMHWGHDLGAAIVGCFEWNHYKKTNVCEFSYSFSYSFSHSPQNYSHLAFVFGARIVRSRAIIPIIPTVFHAFFFCLWIHLYVGSIDPPGVRKFLSLWLTNLCT